MNIIELAKQAGFADVEERSVWISDGHWDEELKAFAALVEAAARADEREACAKVCDVIDDGRKDLSADCAATIRARSNT